ncbi:MAG TPA: Bax inhibitor-1 family protein [Bryobacteraceae bacterium]|jgi:modulator of FtsH protease|nr:Bax inhibitor-1 family protein [Bryobacteraceae bacterium]
MSPSNPNSSVFDRLSATTVLTGSQAAVIKQTYALFGVAVIAAMVGGYVGATTESIVRFFSSWVGWIVAMIGLNAVPRIAMGARANPVLGTAALVFDGFFAGICLAPLLWFASLKAPVMIVAALGITAIVFLAITGYIFLSGRTYSAPRGLMLGLFFSVIGAMILNSFLNIGFLGILIAAGIGAVGVIALISSTSLILQSGDADSAIPGALALFAGVFNIFVATLNILLRLFGGGDRRR